jgi:hypothetical protein
MAGKQKSLRQRTKPGTWKWGKGRRNDEEGKRSLADWRRGEDTNGGEWRMKMNQRRQNAEDWVNSPLPSKWRGSQ